MCDCPGSPAPHSPMMVSNEEIQASSSTDHLTLPDTPVELNLATEPQGRIKSDPHVDPGLDLGSVVGTVNRKSKKKGKGKKKKGKEKELKERGMEGGREMGIAFDDEMMFDALSALYEDPPTFQSPSGHPGPSHSGITSTFTSNTKPHPGDYGDYEPVDGNEDEIELTESQRWAQWPSALDEIILEETFEGMDAIERGWLFFEFVCIEPRLLEDAGTGFPSLIFEAMATRSFVYPSVVPPDPTGLDRVCTIFKERKQAQRDGRREGERQGKQNETEVDEGKRGGETWRTRMKLTTSPSEWLLTLCQSQSIPDDLRDRYILNLCLISYPHAQYLHRHIIDLNIARDHHAAATSSPTASGMSPTSSRSGPGPSSKFQSVRGGDTEREEIKEKKRWIKSFLRSTIHQRASARKTIPANWAGWRINWVNEILDCGNDSDDGSGSDKDLTKRINMVGILAHRPYASPHTVHHTATPDASPDSAMDESEETSSSIIDDLSSLGAISRSTVLDQEKHEHQMEVKVKVNDKGKGKARDVARAHSPEDGRAESILTTDQQSQQTQQTQQTQLIMFEIEQSILSIFEILSSLDNPTGVSKLTHLVHLSLTLLHAPSIPDLTHYIDRLGTMIKVAWAGLEEWERDWLAVDAEFMWDMEILGRARLTLGLSGMGVGKSDRSWFMSDE